MSESNPNEIYTLNRMAHLTAIMDADDAYYNQDDPVMTDAKYDRLRNDYIKKYGSEDLNYVPGSSNAGFEHFTHTTPVTSLGKVKESEPEKLRAAIEKLWPVVIELKYDGLTVVAYPQERGVCKFVTRGNGVVGDVLPNFINRYEGQGISWMNYPARGEVYMDDETFNSINKEKEAAGEETFKNKRNAAAGILRNKERSPYLDRLKYVVYDIPGCPDEWTEQVKIEELKHSTRFDDVRAAYPANVDDAVEYVHSLYEESKDGNIPIDGIVIKSNQPNSLAKFGRTGHHPNNAIAWKAETEKFTTRLIDIEWQVGRDRLTPVAIMEPVEIDGTMVSKASLHNWGNIQKLRLNRNDLMVVEKSNEIIPQIIANEGHIACQDMETTMREWFVKPTKCPVCGAELKTRIAETSKFGDEVEVIYCPNPNCSEKIAQNMAYMARKDVLNIEGLSIETARKICSGYVSSQNDIFECSFEDFESLPGFAKKSAQKLYNNIQGARKKVPLEKFIPAACILNVGHDIGKKLAAKFHSYHDLMVACDMECDETAFSSIDGIGPDTAKVLISMEFTDAMKDLFKYIKPLDYEPPKAKVPGKQYHIAITGKFEQPRSVYEKMITDAGMVIAKSVSSTTTHLMIADLNSTSSKAKKARELGVELIDEKGLEELL